MKSIKRTTMVLGIALAGLTASCNPPAPVNPIPSVVEEHNVTIIEPTRTVVKKPTPPKRPSVPSPEAFRAVTTPN